MEQSEDCNPLDGAHRSEPCWNLSDQGIDAAGINSISGLVPIRETSPIPEMKEFNEILHETSLENCKHTTKQPSAASNRDDNDAISDPAYEDDVELDKENSQDTNPQSKLNVYTIGTMTVHETPTEFHYYLPVPEHERNLDSLSISEEEKEIFNEFFSGDTSNKTVERYMKIRLEALKLWEKMFKPKMRRMNKTMFRSKIKNCGDVNWVGKIHSYLEQSGVVNFGVRDIRYGLALIRKKQEKKLGQKIRIQTGCKSVASPNLQKVVSNSSRKRKHNRLEIRVDGRGGVTIEHGDHNKVVKTTRFSEPVADRKSPKKTPFRLVECKHFTEGNPAPFTVQIHRLALMTMDIHASMFTQEVIGLIGGSYHSFCNTLEIMAVEPCKSTGTQLQCEMDPDLQVECSERLQERGCSVLGWYHSHPVFDAIPSEQDIDTQLLYQDWFGSHDLPFLGLIIHPGQPQSVTNLWMVGKIETPGNIPKDQPVKIHSLEDGNTPYSFDYEIVENSLKDYRVAIRCCRDILHNFDSFGASEDLTSDISGCVRVAVYHSSLDEDEVTDLLCF